MRIIDRDIDFYQAEVETCETALARCKPSEEEYWRQLQSRALNILTSLKAYRTYIDTDKPW